MTSIILSCTVSEKEGIDFQLKFGQDEGVKNEEKAAALYMMPYVKEALERGIRDAEERAKKKEAEQPKIEETLDGGPKIITLD